LAGQRVDPPREGAFTDCGKRDPSRESTSETCFARTPAKLKHVSLVPRDPGFVANRRSSDGIGVWSEMLRAKSNGAAC